MTHDTEKYLNDLRNYVLGLVPEEREYPILGAQTYQHSMQEQENGGWNAAREKKIKENINQADFEPLIRT